MSCHVSSAADVSSLNAGFHKFGKENLLITEIPLPFKESLGDRGCLKKCSFSAEQQAFWILMCKNRKRTLCRFFYCQKSANIQTHEMYFTVSSQILTSLFNSSKVRIQQRWLKCCYDNIASREATVECAVWFHYLFLLNWTLIWSSWKINVIVFTVFLLCFKANFPSFFASHHLFQMWLFARRQSSSQ